MSLKRQAQYRTKVDFTGEKGDPGPAGATVTVTVPTPVTTVVTTPFDPSVFVMLLTGHGRVLTGDGHALWVVRT